MNGFTRAWLDEVVGALWPNLRLTRVVPPTPGNAPAMSSSKTYKFAVIGYGPAFNMGPCHIDSLLANTGFEFAAVCDRAEDRVKAAKEKYPQCTPYTDVDAMLKAEKLDLAIIITPHNAHAPLALKCLNAGVSVVVEKPMAITTQEVSDMVAAAKANKVMLSTFHNRRWDNDFVLLRDLVNQGHIGKVFRIEAGFNGYNQQGTWWRSDRKISGGAIYDWGAHFTDWILNIATGKVLHVTGFQVKNPAWDKYTNEDHSEYTATFENGCVATLTMSNLSAIEKPRWIVRGLQGSIVAGPDAFIIKKVDENGRHWTTQVRYDSIKSDWHAYYRNVCAHLRDGEPLIITPEGAARVISILDSANVSAAQAGAPVVPKFQ